MDVEVELQVEEDLTPMVEMDPGERVESLSLTVEMEETIRLMHNV
jgi:hypothetical protein